VHYMTKAEFEALGTNLTAEKIPVWVDSTYKKGVSELEFGSLSASSVFDNTAQNAVNNAKDGNINTAWSSAFGQQNATITADLGSSKVISAVKLIWDWVFFAKNYTVEVSDNSTTWTVIATATNENGQIDLFKNLKNIKARYVRLNLTQNNAGWYRLGEFEIYTNDCNCIAPTTSTKEPTKTTVPIRVSPNPSSGFIDIEHPNLPNSTIKIFDLQGKQIHQQNTTDAATRLTINHLPIGVYLAVFENRKMIGTQKFMKIGL
jgi:hypothetical protein